MTELHNELQTQAKGSVCMWVSVCACVFLGKIMETHNCQNIKNLPPCAVKLPALLFLVDRGIKLLLQLVQVRGHVITEGHEFLVSLLALGLEDGGVVGDGLIHGGEVIKDEVLLHISHQLHQGLCCPHLHMG